MAASSIGPEVGMTRVVGVVLCGGASSRMGADKALLVSRERPFSAHVGAALDDAGVDEVLLVGGNGARLSMLGRTWIDDDHPGSGPLGAIATVARREPDAALVVCACDLPLITGEDLAPLLAEIAAPSGADGRSDLAVFDVGRRTQWSAVALAPSAAAVAVESFESGERSLRGAFKSPAIRVRHLEPRRPMALRDVDRPEDLVAILGPAVYGTTPTEG